MSNVQPSTSMKNAIQNSSQDHREKHRKYDIAFKYEVILHSKTHSKRETARQYNIDDHVVRRWVKQEREITDIFTKGGLGIKSTRVNKGGRKPVSTRLDELVYQWILDKRADNIRISVKMVKNKAMDLYETDPRIRNEIGRNMDEGINFEASRGWIKNFFKRNNVGIKRKTTQGQFRPQRESCLIRNFILYIRSLRMKNGYAINNIIAADETAVWMDAPGDTTVTPRGTKTVRVKTTKHEKSRVTVLLAAKGDGRKLKPWIIFKGKRMERQLAESNLPMVVKMSENGWVNQDLVTDFLQSGVSAIGIRKLLVWDAYKCHISDRAKAKARQLGVDMGVIPGGCTGIIQAPDVAWNGPFKSAYREKYEEWMSNGEMSYTHGGNLRPPPRIKICEWVVYAWGTLSEELIRRSFLTCALTNSVDGLQDDLIHCLKDGEPASSCKQDLMDLTQQLHRNGGNYYALDLDNRPGQVEVRQEGDRQEEVVVNDDDGEMGSDED